MKKVRRFFLEIVFLLLLPFLALAALVARWQKKPVELVLAPSR